MNKFAKMAVAASIAGMAFVSQAALVVDDFSTGQAKLIDATVDGSGVSSSTASGSGGIFGGQRDLFVEKSIGLGSGENNIKVDPIGSLSGNGLLSFSSDTNATGYGAIRWDGGAGGAVAATGMSFASFLAADDMNLGGYDLFSEGDSFRLTVETADFGFLFQMIAKDTMGGYSKLTLVAGANGTDHTIPFALFVSPIDYTVPNFGRI